MLGSNTDSDARASVSPRWRKPEHEHSPPRPRRRRGRRLAVPAFAEDLTVVFKSTGGGKAGSSTAYYSAEKMRTSDGAADTIIEYGPGRIVTIDHKRKEYSEITMAEMEAALAKMSRRRCRSRWPRCRPRCAR